MKNQKAQLKLAVWQDSLNFVKEIYILTEVFPEEENDGLIKKLKDNAISVPTSISKGLMQNSDSSFKENLFHALNCLAEIDTLLLISLELEYITQADVDNYSEKIEKIKSLTLGIVKKLERNKEKN